MSKKRRGMGGPETDHEPDKPWHQLDKAELFGALQTGVDGLTSREARERLSQIGPNALEAAEATPLWKKFFAQFQDFMILVLLAATAISAFLGEIVDAVTILLIVALNAVLGFVQEFRAEQSLEALKKLTAPEARVIRDGQEVRIRADEVVPGDMVLLEAGDRVPADMRIMESHELEVDEAPLTGESMPVAKRAEPLTTLGLGIGDMANMAFSGTIVTRGRGQGVVTATGMRTEMGRIAYMIESVEDELTPLQRRLDELGKILVAVCLAICLVVVFIGLWQGEPVYRMVLTGVSLAVAAIPEGLPAIVTIVLAIGVQKMIKSRAIIRKLPAVETLGCATAICSDKTGTLTQNQMTVRQVYLNGDTIMVGGQGYEPKGELMAAGRKIQVTEGSRGGTDSTDLNTLLLASVLCNNAEIVNQGIAERGSNSSWSKKKAKTGRGESAHWTINGDPTEGALLVLAAKGGFHRQNVEHEYERIQELPFDSDRKRMAVIIRNRTHKKLSFVKGAPETMLARCSSIRQNGVDVPMTEQKRKQILSENERMAQEALRVLALAYRTLPEHLTEEELKETVEEDLVFLGLVGMMDPPRPGVKQAVERCAKAGIRTVMITGDHPVTAFAVARELGIAQRTEEVITGAQLEEMGEQDLVEKVSRISVFARVSPAHKLRIVRAFKGRGHVVAMTGDGVNDAPAVKESDIGIAMGRTGTDVTKEASSMVLSDDNFVTIVGAVEQGRATYDNIRKFVRYLLSCNAGEVLVMFLASLFAMPLPLLPVQLLWVNLVTDGLPAMALGVDSPDPDVMNRKPRHPKESVLAGGLGRRILIWGTYCGLATLAVFSWGIYLGDLPLARTMAFCTLTFFQLFYVFDCRSDRYSIFELGWMTNPHLLAAVFLSGAMQLAVVYIPWLQKIFQTVPLEPSHWLVVLFMAGGWLLVTGLWHLVSRPFSQNRRRPVLGQ
ncbi:cation-translocating P-type ATPase [Heliobacterium chlorum]|nr:cation-translocating P-type ATPase [Heliobacterium chlorum]